MSRTKKEGSRGETASPPQTPNEYFGTFRGLPVVEKGLRRSYSLYLVNECNLAVSTAFSYEQGLVRLEKFIGKDAVDMDVGDLRRFLRETDYHPSTKGSTIAALKSFHKWGALEGLWEMNGIISVRGPKQVSDPLPSLSREDAATLLQAARRPNEYKVLYLGLFTGMRVSEAASITEKEWPKGKDRIRFYASKTRKHREVPIHPRLAKYRDVILDGSNSDSTLKHVCASLNHWTGIRFSSHTLRRTFGVHLSEAGVSRDVIGELMGHAPATTTVMSYVPIRWKEKVDGLRRLCYCGSCDVYTSPIQTKGAA